jgi:hypothetical protein
LELDLTDEEATAHWIASCVGHDLRLGSAAAFTLPPQLALVAEPMLGFGTVAVLLVWTAAFAQRRAAQR